MVLAHFGAWNQWEEVYDYLAVEVVNLYTSIRYDYNDEDMFMKILEKHGSDKILFATDSPWSDAAEGIKAVRNLPISQNVKDDILWNNAMKLLQMKG